MDYTNDLVAQQRPHSFNRRPSGGTPASEMFGFSVSENQFNVLLPAVSQSQAQDEEGLVDPRSTRLLRLAARRAEDQGTLVDGGVPATVIVNRDAQGILASGYCIDPVVSAISSQFFTHSFSAGPSDILNLQSVGSVHYCWNLV